MQRIAIDTDYIPTVQDVLFARSKTTGITETRFNAGNQLSIQYVSTHIIERSNYITNHYTNELITVCLT